MGIAESGSSQRLIEIKDESGNVIAKKRQVGDKWYTVEDANEWVARVNQSEQQQLCHIPRSASLVERFASRWSRHSAKKYPAP